MPTTYTNGLKLPDLGSIDWYNSYKNNIDILDPIVGTVNGVATTYASISHNHDASEITSGTIDIARLPPAALERLTTVADQTARYALTTSTVQLGDTVKQLDTGIMYLVVDTTKLNSADGYVEYSAGTASKAIADEDGTSIKTGYVNVAGNQTVSGQKTFNSNIKEQLNYTIGETPATTTGKAIQFVSSSGADLINVTGAAYSTGANIVIITAGDRFTENRVKSPTGTIRQCSLQIGTRGNGDRFLYTDGTWRSSLIPYIEYGSVSSDSGLSLGTSTNQWNSVYAKSYYYNGTAWGLDKANVWTQNQTISINLPVFTLQDTIGVRDTTPANARNLIFSFLDKNGDSYGFINRQHKPVTGTHLHQVSINNGTYDYRLQFYLFTNGASNFAPSNDGVIELGTSTNKWKTLNGINPGALSLPDYDKAVNIGTTNWSTAGAMITYAPTFSGWLQITVSGGSGSYITILDSGTTPRAGQRITGDGIDRLFLTYPVVANRTYWIYIVSSSIETARIIPCLGNV